MENVTVVLKVNDNIMIEEFDTLEEANAWVNGATYKEIRDQYSPIFMVAWSQDGTLRENITQADLFRKIYAPALPTKKVEPEPEPEPEHRPKSNLRPVGEIMGETFRDIHKGVAGPARESLAKVKESTSSIATTARKKGKELNEALRKQFPGVFKD